MHAGQRRLSATINNNVVIFPILLVLTWKKSSAPTAKTTPMASPKPKSTASSVDRVRTTWGSSPVPW